MQHSDVLCNTASATLSAEESEKEQRKQKREKFLDRIRDSLESVVRQMALSPAEAAIACGRSPSWSYRKIYSGEFRQRPVMAFLIPTLSRSAMARPHSGFVVPA